METKKKIIISIVSLLVLVGGYFGYQAFTYISTDDAQIEGHALLLAPKVGGYIQAVHVVEGQNVKAGEVLIEIDPRDYENTLKEVEGELTSIEARRRDSEKNFKRLSDLYSKAAIPQQQYDTAATVYSESKARYEAISAQVAQARLNLSNTQIKAPTNGIIAKKSAEVGQLASPGVPLVGFVDTEERWVTANFKETEIEAVKIGAIAYLDIDAISKTSYTGKVIAISSATGATFTLLPPDNATGNFTKVVQRVPIKISIDGLKPADIEQLRAGLSVNVRVKKH
jgi:membrane fusion protein (multidrug efflux system)